MESQLEETRAELESAKAAAVAAAASGQASGAAVAQQAAAARAAALEQAHRRAAEALQEEAAVANKNRAAAETALGLTQGKLTEVEAELEAAKANALHDAEILKQRDAEIEDLRQKLAKYDAEKIVLELALASAAAERAADNERAVEALDAATAASSEIEELKRRVQRLWRSQQCQLHFWRCSRRWRPCLK